MPLCTVTRYRVRVRTDVEEIDAYLFPVPDFEVQGDDELDGVLEHIH